MRAMRRVLDLFVMLLLTLAVTTACGSDSSTDDRSSGQRGEDNLGESNEKSSDSGEGPAADAGDDPLGEILETGFGQSDDYAWVTALVRNNTDEAGQTVTVSFNALNTAGDVVATGSQVQSFNWSGQEVPVGTQIEIPGGEKVASVDATLLVEDDGTFDDLVSEDLGTFPGEIVKQYGDWSARFTVTNPTDELLDTIAFFTICHNEAGDIIGGNSDFPELIPASGEIVVEPLGLYLSEKPAECTGYLTPWSI